MNADGQEDDEPVVGVFLEPWGDQQLKVAGGVRLAAVSTNRPVPEPYVWPFFSDLDRAFWDKATERVSQTISDNVRCSTCVAPMVQDQERIALDRGTRRLLVMLGQGAAREGLPDGLPWDFPNNSEMKKWVEYERELALAMGKAIADMLAASLEVDAQAITPSFSFVFKRGAWRPAFSLRIGNAKTKHGTDAWPVPDNVRELVGTIVGFIDARHWVWTCNAGESRP